MAKNGKRKDFTPVRNKELYDAMMERRRSSAASRHVLKSRKETRAQRNKKEMSFGW